MWKECVLIVQEVRFHSLKTDMGAPKSSEFQPDAPLPIEAHVCHWLCRSISSDYRGDPASHWLDDLRMLKRVSPYCENLSL